MSCPATITLTVDDSLRFILYGLSVLLDIDLHPIEIERLFAASASGDSSAQHYELHRSPRIFVVADVDEYEPGAVHLAVTAPRFDASILQRLLHRADHAAFAHWLRQRNRP